MRELTFSVPRDWDSSLLKNFLRRRCDVSARLLARLKREPCGISVNGAHATALTLLRAGDAVRLVLPADDKLPTPKELPIAIVYEDEDLLVVDKPADMPVYPTPGHDSDTLANAVSFCWRSKGRSFSFRPVYRLDKNTSGLIVLAKNAYAASFLSHRIQKEYTAVCEGMLTGSGVIDRPILLAPGSKIRRAVGPAGTRAVTRWESEGCLAGHTLLKLRMETGRTHQIRVHMASIGHPLAGDDLYGGHLGLIRRQALHCGDVRLIHPVEKKEMELSSALPEDMEKLLCLCHE